MARPPAPENEVVGTCGRCGVQYAGQPGQRERLLRMLAAHERVCPGGTRVGETVTPLASSEGKNDQG